MKLSTLNPFSGLEEFTTENESMAARTWYKIGGPARYFIRPRSAEELQQASQRCAENNIPIYVLGLGANLLVSDVHADRAGPALNQLHQWWSAHSCRPATRAATTAARTDSADAKKAA